MVLRGQQGQPSPLQLAWAHAGPQKKPVPETQPCGGVPNPHHAAEQNNSWDVRRGKRPHQRDRRQLWGRVTAPALRGPLTERWSSPSSGAELMLLNLALLSDCGFPGAGGAGDI